MTYHRITKGLDLPIRGKPQQAIEAARSVSRVALLPSDHAGLRPRLLVGVGDAVRRGQALFEDKKTPGVRYTAPGAGTVLAIHRGPRRVLLSVVIELSEAEREGATEEAEQVEFDAFKARSTADLSGEEIEALLLESGLWTTLRTRPFSTVPAPGTRPRSVFVTAMDTNPLAADVGTVLQGNEDDFREGVQALMKLSAGPTFVCLKPGSSVAAACPDGARVEEFDGPHPAGTAGIHIHLLDPVNRDRVVWHINYQDVLAVGKLLKTGRLPTDRVIALGGPQVRKPRLLKTRAGASLDELVEGELLEGENRVISGSVLSGRKAMGEVEGYLGRFHLQVSVLREGREREFFGWTTPGRNKFSVLPIVISRLFPRRLFDFTTSTHGSPRAIVPIGVYERVFPFDMVTTYLLRALSVDDIEESERLGCLELDEEDLALCSFVCPGKSDFGSILRRNLDLIEKEG